MYSDLEVVILWGISHHLSTIRHHKFTKYIPSVDLKGGDLKKKNVVSVAFHNNYFEFIYLSGLVTEALKLGE